MRSALGCFLVVVLAVTSLSGAVARGQADAAGTMVICRGLTVVTVPVDAQGQPVEISHICPDAVLTLFADVGGAPVWPAHMLTWTPVVWVCDLACGASAPTVAAQARGPPSFL